MILETVVYCGREKKWRILNLNTGTVYAKEFEKHEMVKAIDSIEHGTLRGGLLVQYVSLLLITQTVEPTLGKAA